MEHEGFYMLGYTARTHGVKGNLLVLLDVDDPGKYRKINALFLEENSSLTKFPVTSSTVSGAYLNVKLEGIDDMTTAEDFLKRSAFLPLTELPPLSAKQLYLHEAPGMKIIDANLGELGVVFEVFDLPEQPVASFLYHEKEVLFPVISTFIERVDRVNRILYVNLPEGLIDVYLG